MKAQLLSRLAGAGLAALLVALPAVALADAPDFRGPDSAPSGSVASPDWSGVAPLPPIGAWPAAGGYGLPGDSAPQTAGIPAATVYPQAVDPRSATAAFSLRSLNPGNWVLDAGMGIVSATMQSIQQTLLGFVVSTAGVTQPPDEQAAVLGCSGGMGFLFCTRPEHILPPYNRIGPQFITQMGVVPAALHKVWLALQPAAYALLTLVFTVRLGRVMYAGPAALQAEVKALLLPFLAACALVAAAPWLLRILLQFFGALNGAILGNGALGGDLLPIPYLTYQPTDFLATMALGPTFALLALYIVLFLVFVVAIVRLVKLALLFALAPLAGATLIDRSTAPYFQSWLSKVVELLLQQVGWSVAALVGSAMLNTISPGRASDPVTDADFVLQIIGTTLILLMMLNQQLLFGGVFSVLGAGSGGSGGDLLGKASSVISVADGFLRAKAFVLGPRAASVAGPAAAKSPASPPGRPSGAGWQGRRFTTAPIASSAQPGARARAAATRPGAATAPQAAIPNSAPPAARHYGDYIAAGRRRPQTTPSAPASGAALAVTSAQRLAIRRVLLDAHVQRAQTQTRRQSPASIISSPRPDVHAVSSERGRRALRRLQSRPRPASGAVSPKQGDS